MATEDAIKHMRLKLKLAQRLSESGDVKVDREHLRALLDDRDRLARRIAAIKALADMR